MAQETIEIGQYGTHTATMTGPGDLISLVRKQQAGKVSERGEITVPEDEDFAELGWYDGGDLAGVALALMEKHPVTFRVEEAARKHLLTEARYMARSITINVVTDDEGREEWARAYQNVRIVTADAGAPLERAYVPLATALASHWDAVAADVRRAFLAARKKYDQYQALPGMTERFGAAVAAIDEALAAD